MVGENRIADCTMLYSDICGEGNVLAEFRMDWIGLEWNGMDWIGLSEGEGEAGEEGGWRRGRRREGMGGGRGI